MRTEVATSHLRVTPGTPAILDVEVTNTADVIDGITAGIQGLDPSWVSLVVPVVSLFPNSSSRISMRIDLPKNCLAGEYLVSVHVVSIIDPERFSDHEFWLSVEPFAAGSLEMHPAVIIGGKDAEYAISIANEGNVPLDLVINTLDETRQLTCVANPATVSIPPGETHTVDLLVRGRRPWFGQPVSRSIKIKAQGNGLELDGLATFTQKPRIPRGVITIIVLALIIALWATIFLVVIGLLRSTKPTDKAIATNFNKGGDQQVDLKTMGGSIAGTVTAQSTQAPVPRITVQAFRLDRNQVLQPIGSTATGDDGTYSLASLLPGDYKLEFSAQGYTDTWFPAAPDSGSATIVTLKPGVPVTGTNMVLVGLPGTMSGQVNAGDGSGGTPKITVTVQQVIDKPQPGQTLPEQIPATVDATGKFTVDIPITPATYDLHMESANFQPVDIKEVMAAGENKVVNTVTLGASPGTVQGVVTDGNNTPLGDVEVTISDGDFVKKTKTPTSGNTGSFVLDQLKTPATYVITFTLPGYTSSSQSFALGSGETKVLNAQLLGGTGTISGSATDTAGHPLGGVTVVINHGAVSATTSTLTAASAAGDIGSYSIAALPTPDPYTVTFSLAGYDSQTIAVLLPSAGSLTAINAVLPMTNGSVGGTVTVAGVPTAGVTVVLSDGTTPRSTSTAGSPLGAYSFPGVAPGSYTLTFSQGTVVAQVVVIDVVGDQVTTQNVNVSMP
ncbi:MAG TPA: carboxypeptidase regulatory-like domain-containing protein [Ilumatobacteraceae bacterium]